MAEQELPGNSQSARKQEPREEPKKKIEQVTTGEVTRRKPGLGKRFRAIFLGNGARSVGEYMFMEVFLPAARDMVFDLIREGGQRLIYGESRTGRTAAPRDSRGYVSYNRYSQPERRPPFEGGRRVDDRMSRRGRATHNFEEIVIANRGEAERVLDQLYMLIDQYEQATVADLYETVGLTGNFTDEKWGWTSLVGARVRRDRDGYLLDLPRPEQLD